ncbi:MAG: hypothetical protein KC550_08075, partial [Nanoarchaeota archaeon]|nr:hypothetical protein [Nanoarchaeota archaeon]
YIRKSYASGDVSGNWSIGGFVGRAFTSFISDSYASGDVSGNLNIGGFVGQLSGAGSEIQNSFATGNVNGNTSVGGFAGTNSQIINNSYSTGNVDAVLINWGGGFAGYNSGILLNSFWNNVSGNSNISIGNDTNAQIVTTIQNDISWFYNSSNPPMINWTSSIWYFSGSGFPQLAWTVPSSPTSIAGIFPI